MGATVVTGAARGIGAASALALAGKGTLVACDLREQALDDIVSRLEAAGHSVECFAGDLTDPGVVGNLVERVQALGGLDALAHCAGLSGTMAEARAILEINLVSTARLLIELLPQVNEGAAAVLLASQAGHLSKAGLASETLALLSDPIRPDLYEQLEAQLGDRVSAPSGAYGLSKRGVQLLAVAHALAWGERGGRIVSVSPGIVDTEMGQSEFEANKGPMAQIFKMTPAGPRMGRPEEISNVVAFLCSDAASFVSGVDWLVDGGSTNQMIGG